MGNSDPVEMFKDITRSFTIVKALQIETERRQRHSDRETDREISTDTQTAKRETERQNARH